MTFGEKLKTARQQAGYSQEELAAKLSVSRSAVAKWETGKGMPDIENLKATAALLNVSIDYLLDEGEALSMTNLREAICLDDYEKGGKARSKQDAAVLDKFPQAVQIYALVRKKKLSRFEHLLEWTVMPSFGIFEAVDQINNNASYYLVETDKKRYLVCISKEFIDTTELARHISEKRFVIADSRFSRLYTLK
ncbi:MAG: helix-turn-helix transcriptional regulator [Ruminococcus sp.]|nr:helix-turn-helix transcriptional regulator [Ruminococcus sp.]